jgi:hypothetical protein
MYFGLKALSALEGGVTLTLAMPSMTLARVSLSLLEKASQYLSQSFSGSFLAKKDQTEQQAEAYRQNGW